MQGEINNDDYIENYGKINGYKAFHDPDGIGDYSWYLQKKEADVVSEELTNIDISNRNYKGLWSA